MKFNVKNIKSIKTRHIHDFVTSPAGFLTTVVVSGVVLAAAAKVGSILSESIERRKAREEAERNTIEHNSIETLSSPKPLENEVESSGVVYVNPDDIEVSDGVAVVNTEVMFSGSRS